MNYKVCILAAGIGSRMSPLTDKINKSLLPVDFKAVLSHIIEKFDSEVEIVLAIGHLKETILDYLECAHADRNFTIVDVQNYSGEGSGPGYSLMQCKSHLNMPFIFFASDTLVLEDIPPPSENWLGVSEVIKTEQYCTVEILENKIVKLVDKTVNNNKLAFIGVAGVFNHAIFFDALQKNNEIKLGEFQVSNGFSALTKCNLAPKAFTWHDTGNKQGYEKANEYISTTGVGFNFSKDDEFLYFVNGNVIKFFADSNIIQNRYERALSLQGLCPKIECFKSNFYSYKKVEGRVLYDVINDNIMDNLISWLDTNLWIDKKLNESEKRSFKSNCFSFYYQKTINRLTKYYKKHNVEDAKSFINGVAVPKIEEMFNLINWDEMVKGIPSVFHGDLQLDNILLTDEDKFLLLDWRQDFAGLKSFGDRYYDFAKLNGGLQVSYKLIKQNSFSYSVEKNGNIEIVHDVPDELVSNQVKLANYFIARNVDIKKVNILTSLIYLNMAPMHNEPFDHFIYNLGKLKLSEALYEFEKS